VRTGEKTRKHFLDLWAAGGGLIFFGKAEKNLMHFPALRLPRRVCKWLVIKH